MQALHYIEPGKLEWLEIDKPKLVADTDVLVKPLAVAACDLDRSITSGKSPFPGPFVLGHEFCGRVQVVGESVSTVSAGDVVIASFQPSCGTCLYCGRGHSSVCSSVPATSMYGIGAAGGNWSGALADLIRVPWGDVNLRRLPEELDAISLASGSDNLADGLRAVDKPLEKQPGASVLVAGSGSIPLYALLCAEHLGAGQLTLASDDPFALQVGESLGAECLEVTDWSTRFRAHDITLDCTGVEEGLTAVVKSTTRYGYCTSASIYFTDLTPVPMRDMYMKGITLKTGRVNSAAQLDRVLQLAMDGLDPGKIQPRFVNAAGAIEAFATTPTSQKLVVTCE